MSNVNIYYLGTPRHIFVAELDSGLITKTEEQIKLQFPDVAQAAMPTHAQSLMV